MTTIIALSGIFVVQRAAADSSGASAIRADGSPTLIAALPRYIAVGDAHTCVVLDDATLRCFGSNSSGQVGTELAPSGAAASIGDVPGEMGDALVAVNLGSGRTVRAVSAGNAHTCVLLDDGSVKCFGEGDHGRLGRGSTADVGRSAGSMGDSLSAVALGTGRTATAIATGAAHTCALLDNGAVKCWGANDDGQLGLGDTDARGDEPGEMGDALAPVDLGLSGGVRVAGIAAGDVHTCALLSNGAVKCWGFGGNGRLGSGNEDSRGDEPSEMGSALVEVDLGTNRRALALSAGAQHTCVVRDTNDVVCWGVGATGRLGTGAETDIGDELSEMGDALVAVPLGTERTAIAVSAGGSHTCAVLDDATAKCWGNGASGRLGSGDIASLGNQPNELGDALPPIALGAGRSVRAIAAGVAHTCVVLDTFALKCFGLGTNGRLGSGSTATLGDAEVEMGDNLTAVNLGTDRRVASLTEPGRAGTLVGTTGDGQITLTWAAPDDDGGSPITEYVVEYSSDGETWQQVSLDDATATSATVTELANGTGYRFRVTARNEVGDGVTSLTSDEITPSAPTTTTSTTTTTLVAAPSSGGGGSESIAPVATTTTAPAPSTTTTTSTTTTIPASSTTTTTPATSTTTTVPVTPTTLARPVRSLMLRPFPPLSAALSVPQRRQINRFAASLAPSDEVVCVGGAGSGPLRVLRDLARLRAAAVCSAIAQRSPGVRTKVDIALSGVVQVGETSTASQSGSAQQPAQQQTQQPAPQQTQQPAQQPAPIRVAASDLSRRVLVVARPNPSPPRL